MKTIILLLAAVTAGFVSIAQTTITHSNSQIVVPDNGITCAQNGTGIVENNQYYGVFDLTTDFGIVDHMQIRSVEIGIEDARDLLNGTYPITINAYTTDDGTPNGNLTLLGGDTLIISNVDELSVVSLEFPIGVVVPAGGVLVIELRIFKDGQSVFRLGTTNIQANDESWGHAPSCGFPIPITYTEAGFLDAWNIINVVGVVELSVEDTVLEKVSMYPNPTTGKFAIDLVKSYSEINVVVTNMLGQQINSSVFNNTKVIDLNIEGASGIYFVSVSTSEGKTTTLKVVKE